MLVYPIVQSFISKVFWVIPYGKNITTNHHNDYDRGLNDSFCMWQLAPGRVSRGELVLSERPDIVFTFIKSISRIQVPPPGAGTPGPALDAHLE